MSRLMRTIALGVGLVMLAAGAVQADTGLVVANTSGYDVTLNYNTPIPSPGAAWSALPATVVGPGDSIIKVVDTHKSCGRSRWTIAFNFYRGGKLYHRGSYCIHLEAQLGCMALHLSTKGAGWAEVAGAHCSQTWWSQHGAKAVQMIINLVGAVVP